MNIELKEEKSLETYVELGVSISLLKTLINTIYYRINEEICENKQEISNLSVMLKRMINDIENQYNKMGNIQSN